MDSNSQLFKELVIFADDNLNLDDYFLCVYGSYATSHFTSKSDLDLFIAANNYESADFDKILNFVVHFHTRNNLKLDDEVPYENKLLISYKDIEDAATLEPFIKTGHKYIVPEIKYNKEFLGSRAVRLRLILNALTSPNQFICGNELKYRELKKVLEKAIIRLALGLFEKDKPTADDIMNALLVGEHGEEGQAHLGYKKDRKEVVEYLRQLILRHPQC